MGIYIPTRTRKEKCGGNSTHPVAFKNSKNSCYLSLTKVLGKYVC